MTLNALEIDPRRTWKGAWRWFSETMLDCCKSMEEIKRDGITLNQAACLARCNGCDVSVHRYGTFDGSFFRRMLREACSSEDLHIVVSYSRKTFLQSGDGHFSPVGGYHPGRDLVLILDVARFKYAPHWVRVDDLLEAMSLPDPAIGRPRGFLMLSCRSPRESALFAVAPAAAATTTTTESTASTTASEPVHLRSGVAVPALDAAREAVAQVLSGAVAALGDEAAATAAAPATVEAAAGGGGDGVGASGDPAWAAALRFLTADAPELMRRLLADPAAARRDGSSGDETHDDAGGEDEAAEGAGDGDDGGEAAPPAATGGCSVPTLESVVEALVAAAPVESACALLTQRRTAVSVGEGWTGPCCGCPGAGVDVNAVPMEARALRIAPCNSHGCVVRLTEAAVAAAAAADSAAQAPCPQADAAEGRGNAGSSSESDAGSLESAGPSDSSFGSASSSGSGGSKASAATLTSSETAGSRGACCHGEPLEHHCVPPQVQALVADELRFTHMYKLVAYCLRRLRGCSHVQPPDLTAFMQPAMAKPAQPPPVAEATAGAAAPSADPTSQAPPPVAAREAVVTACASTPATDAAYDDKCIRTSGSSSSACDCGELGLPDMAAEKLTALLLLLPPGGDWWPDAAATSGATAAAGRVRVCSRPRCRRCRMRAAAAGDRAAALEVLKERWSQTQRLVPLGLYASSPVLQEELAYIRLQVTAAASAGQGGSLAQGGRTVPRGCDSG